MTLARRLAALVAAALVAGPLSAQEPLRVGFRADAPPFSSEAADGSYEGFLADLCREALSGLEVQEVRVTAENRFDMLARGAASGGVDMLCDPTSAQRQVIERFLVSPLVFATGVGYLRRTPVTRMSDDVVIGYLDGTTSTTAVEIALATGAVKALRDGEIVRRSSATHDEGLRQLCEGEVEFYFGDLDILRSVLARVREERPCDRVTDSEATTFSYEAYVLSVNPDRPDVALKLQSRLFRIFSDGTANRIYARNFGEGRRKSDALQAVFALNGVLPCTHLVSENPCEALED